MAPNLGAMTGLMILLDKALAFGRRMAFGLAFLEHSLGCQRNAPQLMLQRAVAGQIEHRIHNADQHAGPT